MPANFKITYVTLKLQLLVLNCYLAIRLYRFNVDVLFQGPISFNGVCQSIQQIRSRWTSIFWRLLLSIYPSPKSSNSIHYACTFLLHLCTLGKLTLRSFFCRHPWKRHIFTLHSFPYIWNRIRRFFKFLFHVHVRMVDRSFLRDSSRSKLSTIVVHKTAFNALNLSLLEKCLNIFLVPLQQ